MSEKIAITGNEKNKLISDSFLTIVPGDAQVIPSLVSEDKINITADAIHDVLMKHADGIFGVLGVDNLKNLIKGFVKCELLFTNNPNTTFLDRKQMNNKKYMRNFIKRLCRLQQKHKTVIRGIYSLHP